MSIVNYKTFDLDRQRPKVLLTGNGLAYSTGISWDYLIKKTARPGVDVSQLEIPGKAGKTEFAVPNTVLTLAISEIEDKQRHKTYIKRLDPNDPEYEKPKKEPNPEDVLAESERRKALLALPFDAVLTTNYTYEWEDMLHPGYSRLSREQKRRYAYVIEGKPDAKYLLHTFNRFREDKPDIWHVHGELRRPSSLILSHDEYARQAHAILSYNKGVRNGYAENRGALRFESWIDYLILGDVYILGLGMDYSEFDLWWLLGRRLREKAGCGSIIFYERETDKSLYKQRALRNAGVSVETCGSAIGKRMDYASFYENAIEDIRERITSS